MDTPGITSIYEKLSFLRRRIRVYVIVQGTLLAFIWLCLLYFIGLALDYGPVLLAFNEMPVQVRAIFLIITLSGVTWILYQWGLRRLRTSLSDQSLALLLERRFPELRDSVATIVNRNSETSTNTSQALAGNEPPAPHPVLVEQTLQQANERLEQVSLNHVFNYWPIFRAGAVATLLASAICWFMLAQPQIFSTSFRRLFLLDSVTWPRVCYLEIVGLKIDHRQPLDSIPEMNQLIFFDEQGCATVGRASSIKLLIRAEAPSKFGSSENTAGQFTRQLPRTCQLQYWSDDGISGQLDFEKMGGVRDGFQQFSLEGQIFAGLLGDLSFYVTGGDFRIGPFQIKTVPAPLVLNTDLQCQFPEYMVDESSMRWTPRTITWNGMTELPAGTEVHVIAHTNRPLSKVFVTDAENELLETIVLSKSTAANGFEIALPHLQENQHLNLVLQDTAGVFSQQAHLFTLGVIEDHLPKIKTRLRGIGSAITPQARIPVSGRINDDYGVQRSWIEVETHTADRLLSENQLRADGNVEGEIDLLAIQRRTHQPLTLPTTPDSQISLTVMATDHYNLGGREDQGQVALGSSYSLAVVSAGVLLGKLERLESDQRRHLEQIYSEMTKARTNLLESQAMASPDDNRQPDGFEPGDSIRKSNAQSNTENPLLESGVPKLELRKLYVLRALLQTQKSKQEVLGVAAAFEDVRLQLINNRIDSQDRQQRLQEAIIQPLQETAAQPMTDLESTLDLQDKAFAALSTNRHVASGPSTTRDPQNDELEKLATQSLEQVDQTLLQLQSVLGVLKKFETHNELLDLVRNMIQSQEQLLQRTKAERNRQSFEDLLK